MKYDVRFCRCGRVHFIDYEKLCQVCDDQGKEVIHICNNCGAAFRRGLEEYLDGKAWYAADVIDAEITDTSKIGWIIASQGERIHMKTGGQATDEVGGTFIDWETPKPKDVSEREWEVMRRTVDTQATINFIGNKEKLKALSGYLVDIDWSGTKYERKR